jgi:hypothetical protein
MLANFSQHYLNRQIVRQIVRQLYKQETQGDLYPKSLELHGGGKRMRPHELSTLSDWGE